MDKFAFYDEHGVEKYYVFDPDTNGLRIYTRGRATLKRVWNMEEFVSPRLKIRFDLSGEEMVVFGPDGRPFLTLAELEAERLREQQRADNAEQRADNAEQRAARLAALSLKLLNGQASDEEKAELARLAAPPSA